ncbi:MAG: AAA family ATPase [Pseudanabaena sp.]|jgi:AAA15 family ATPase/GTPase
MLLDFTVENFRSIKGAETLSAVAASKSKAKPSNSESSRRVKSDDEIAQPFHVEGWDIDVLPVIAIFGANASGKSNVLKALEYLLSFMFAGNYDHGSHLIPFKLDSKSLHSPTRFKLRTVFDRNIYTYYLELNSTRIFAEMLEYLPVSTKRVRLLYSRNWNIDSHKYDWKIGSNFSGAHNQLKDSLQERESFMSLLVRLQITLIKPLIDWLFENCFHDNWGHYKIEGNALNLIREMPSLIPNSSYVLENTKYLLNKFDTGIYDIEIKKTEDDERSQIYALHKKEDGEIVSWKFEEESTGTQNLFSLAYTIQFIFQHRHLLRSDELGSNIHPNIVREIIKLFQDSKTNPHRTQLIFTSHDNTLQRNNLLRRDQIWFTQKRPDQSTELYSLSDFKVRNDLAIDKAYLDGRFGAVPFISDEDDFMPIGKDNG